MSQSKVQRGFDVYWKLFLNLWSWRSLGPTTYKWTLVGGKDVCVSPMYNTIEKILVGTLQQLKFHLNVKKNIGLAYVDHSESYETKWVLIHLRIHSQSNIFTTAVYICHNDKLLSNSISILSEAKSRLHA